MEPLSVLGFAFSVGLNIYQALIHGEAISERDICTTRLEAVATDEQQERRNTVLESDRRALAEARITNTLTESRARRRGAVKEDSGVCGDTSPGDYGDRLVDDTRRLVEELSDDRLQPSP